MKSPVLPRVEEDLYREHAGWRAEFDESLPSGRIAAELARVEFADWEATRAVAARMAGILRVLDAAEEHPEVYLTLVAEADREDRGLAVRAAGADLAVRLHMSEQTVFATARTARTLRDRTPGAWTGFLAGEVSVANARHLAEVLESIPVAPGRTANPDVDAALEHAALQMPLVAPARFRHRMRILRDRLHPQTPQERRECAVSRRRVVVDRVEDGMSWLGIYATAPVVEQIRACLDSRALHLAEQPGETRTLDQLRADIATDLLTGHPSHSKATVQVGVTVPVLTLLGKSDEPGMLDGYGPIDPDTARRLAADAPSFHRILTHPISGTILDVDRTTYRVPADLRRWIRIRDQHCVFPGCGRTAAHCDIDHTIQWSRGGTTADHNLAVLCPSHHRLKDRTDWALHRHPDSRRLTWTSPTGFTSTADPPPF